MLDYPKISQETVGLLSKARASLQNSPVPEKLRALIELRISQINQCKYCCNLHANTALKLGITQETIDTLENWEESVHFTDAERACFDWAENLTKLKADGKRKVEETNLASFFNEREIVDITICIGMMNMFNRLALSMKD